MVRYFLSFYFNNVLDFEIIFKSLKLQTSFHEPTALIENDIIDDVYRIKV